MVRKSAICRLAGFTAFLFCSLSYGQPTLSSPANGAVNQPLVLTLTWTATAGTATYTVQIALSSSFSPTLLNQTGIPVTDLAISGLSNNTTYYWRVEYGSGAGGWSGVWSFGTVPPAPASPVQNSPANGYGAVSLSPSLSWNSVAGTTSYTVQLSSVPNFSNFILNKGGVAGLSQTVSGLSGSTMYYWQVSATNAGGTSAWSGVWSFMTIVVAPVAPILSTPTNNSVNQPTFLTLTWKSVAGAYYYNCSVSTRSDYETSNGGADLTATHSNSLTLFNDSTYYWKVEAANSAGLGPLSSLWSFTVIPAAPILSLPANGATGQATSLTLSWNTTATAATYAVQVSSSSAFTFGDFVTDTAGITALSSPVTGLSPNTTYYWRANATNIGGTGIWSSIWSFSTTNGGPSAPVLSSPSNGSYVGATTTLSWSLDIGASTYTLQVSSTSAFATTVIYMSGLTSTSQVIKPPFIYPTLSTLYWRVNATNSGGTSNWSSIWSIRSTLIRVLPSIADALPSRATVKCNELGYSLGRSGPVSIAVSDILGRRTVLLDHFQAAGSYTLGLKNFRLPPGAYILHFKSAGLEKRMVVMLPGN